MIKINYVIPLVLSAAISFGQAQKEPTKRFTGSEYAHASDLDVDQKFLVKQIQGKLSLLETDFNLLINHSSNPDPIINSAMERLWNNDNTKLISVSTPGSSAAPSVRPVRTYLTNMTRLHYKEVKITFSKFTYISDFKKQPNGTYTGTIKFEQTFEAKGGADNVVLVSDRVEKNLEVVVTLTKITDSEGKLKERIDVYFGNMSVTDIRG